MSSASTSSRRSWVRWASSSMVGIRSSSPLSFSRAWRTFEAWPESFWGRRKTRACSEREWRMAWRTHQTA